MSQPLTFKQKFRGRVHAVGRLVLLSFRFLFHPGDFLRLYQREAMAADTVLDVALISLEQEFQERLAELEARVVELEGRLAAAPGPSE